MSDMLQLVVTKPRASLTATRQAEAYRYNLIADWVTWNELLLPKNLGTD